jgi:hypothetical protein
MTIAAQNPLGLRIPEPAPPRGEVLTRPGELADWIKRLPVASASSTAKQLVRLLQDLNRSRLPANQRLPLADLLTPAVTYAVRTLESRYADCALPMSEKTLRIAQICNHLCEELAFSYKLVIQDLITGRIGQQERKILIAALSHAVYHLAEAVYQSTLIYDPPTRHVWRELHNLFAFAETNKWATTKVRINTDDRADSSTLRDNYLKILLFSCAAPYSLRQKEMRILYRQLGKWSDLALLGSASTQAPSPNRFVVQLRSDEQPQHSQLLGDNILKPALVLDTTHLVHRLKQVMEEMPEERGEISAADRSEDPTRDLLRRVIQVWSNAPRRRSVRTRLNFDLEVAVGLNPIHGRIRGDDDRQGPSRFANGLSGVDVSVEEVNPEPGFSSDWLDHDSGLTLEPIDETKSGRIYLRGYDSFGVVTEHEREPASGIWNDGRAAAQRERNSKLRTINESAGGYCVNWHSSSGQRIKIGELIGIQAPDNTSNYGLTVVRWMRNETGLGLLVGLQLIAPNTFAVSATKDERRRHSPAKCLLVPEMASTERLPSLVAPILLFKIGDYLHIQQGTTEQRVRLTRLLELTGAFAQFQFEYD